jgi:hypothetical protein
MSRDRELHDDCLRVLARQAKELSQREKVTLDVVAGYLAVGGKPSADDRKLAEAIIASFHSQAPARTGPLI